MYKQLNSYINNAKDHAFKSALMRLAVVEIKLKSGEINEDMMLYDSGRGCWSEGYYYEDSAIIKDKVPEKALRQLKNMIIEGCKIDFSNSTQIRNWIAKTTGISDCVLSL